jgi:hypothetical protein
MGLAFARPILVLRGLEAAHPRLVSLGSFLGVILYHSSHLVTRQSFSSRLFGIQKTPKACKSSDLQAFVYMRDSYAII